MKKKLITTLIILFSFTVSMGMYNIALSKNSAFNKIAAQSQVKPKAQSQTQTAQKPAVQQTGIINTTPLAIVNNPEKFLNKKVKIQATFDKFSTLGLDYSKALRKSTDYIGILIQRDDVVDHNIPLSEMKLFLKKEMAEKHIDLDTGDKIEITANVFSTALKDPWLDIEELKVIKKVKKEEEK